MRIALDAQLTLGTATGIGEYVHGLLPALLELGGDIESLQCRRFDPWRFDRRVLWDQALLPIAARRADLLHCTAGTMPLFTDLPVVVTVHDVAWLRVQAHTRWYARAYFGAAMLHAYRRAKRIIVVSEFSRQELLSCLDIPPERVVVIHNGVDETFSRIVRSPLYEPPTILAVGTIEPRKNLGLLIQALARMKQRPVRLLAVGPTTPYREECEQLAVREGVRDHVDFLGYVSREELFRLYATVSFAAMPSRYEGFGYGAAQALVAGVPLIASSASSLPEIVGQAGILVDPDRCEAWAEVLDQMSTDPLRYERKAQSLRTAAATRFRWATAARKTYEVYHNCCSSRPKMLW